jgi:hypothetical protein
MPAALAKSARGKRFRILVIDVGGNHVKLQFGSIESHLKLARRT